MANRSLIGWGGQSDGFVQSAREGSDSSWIAVLEAVGESRLLRSGQPRGPNWMAGPPVCGIAMPVYNKLSFDPTIKIAWTFQHPAGL